MKNGKKIGILIVAYNAVTTLTKVLDRIPKNVYDEIDEIAVFDDASKDDTYTLTVGYKEVNKLEKLNIYLNDRNLGYGGNQKNGFSYFSKKEFDAVVLLHGDGQYAPEILSEMYSPIIEDKADVVLGSRMMKKYGGALKGGMPFYKFIGNKILSVYENRVLKMNLTEFHSGYRAYSIDTLNKINLENCSNDFHFDTQIIIKANHIKSRIVEIPIPTYYGEEICYVNGMKYAKNIYKTVKEYMNTINGKIKGESYAEYFNNYPLKLYPHSSHYIVNKYLNNIENKRILDIGCGNGDFANLIHNNNEKTGVDFLQVNKVKENAFDSYFEFNLNDGLPESIKKNKYDTILLLDILEHLNNYHSILNNIGDLLNENGTIVVSLPNVANIYVRLNLLLGRFPYSERGILDKTHLHFFTLGSVKKILKLHGLKISKFNVTPIPIMEILPDFLKNNLGRVLNHILFFFTFLFKRLLGYQFVFFVKKK
jgi:2-polyprenyl-3-methyl-5-hydroxy-6-metoxy-1,4-benzoquinol methylase